jgi:hypothetical protein
MAGMPSWATIFFTMGVGAIERAYRASRESVDGQISKLDARWKEHLAAVEVGTAVTVEMDEETGHYFDFGEHIGEMATEAEERLRMVREAFVLILYHYWEKKARELLHIERYGQKEVFAAAKHDPRFDVDEPGINRLRLIANCIKHDAGRTLFNEDPAMFEADLLVDWNRRSGWHDALRLRDEDVEKSFAAVRSSGPKTEPRTDMVEEVEF